VFLFLFYFVLTACVEVHALWTFYVFHMNRAPGRPETGNVPFDLPWGVHDRGGIENSLTVQRCGQRRDGRVSNGLGVFYLVPLRIVPCRQGLPDAWRSIT
jgi:hypothetical protein